MSSIQDIAVQAKVSKSTVSLVLNGKGDQLHISKETQQRVLETAKLLNYRPNISAKRLRNSEDKVLPVIALFWTSDTRSALLGRFLSGVQFALSSMDLDIDLMIQPFRGSHLSDVRSLIIGTRFTGAILTNLTEEDERYLESIDLNVPIVLYHRTSTKYSCVNIDNYKNGCEVASLFSNRGHRDVGIIIPNVSSAAVQLRKQGFMDKAKDLGLNIAQDHIAYGNYSELGGYNCLPKLMQSSTKPTAIFALSDQMAVGVLAALSELSIKVPDQIELVGHDDYEIAQFTIPSLTTMHLPIEELAKSCVEILVDIMSHNVSSPISKVFDSHLIIRKSCGGFIK